MRTFTFLFFWKNVEKEKLMRSLTQFCTHLQHNNAFSEYIE